MSEKLRIVFASDVHGSDRVYKKFLKSAEFYNAQVLVLGGDVTGKAIIPILATDKGGYISQLYGEHHEMSEASLGEFVQRVKDAGLYPYVTSKGTYEGLKEDKEKLQALFEDLMVERMKEWIKLAEERLGTTGVKVYISPGNDDTYAIDPVLSSSKFVTNPEGQVVEVGGYQMATLGITNPTPWHTPREQNEDELYATIRHLVDEYGRFDDMIFNFHCPPYGTPLDLAPRLDEQFHPVMSGDEVEIVHVGSTAVRRAIEELQPMLGVHGHIHESRGVCRIGKTVCLNPGSEYGEGLLRCTIIDLKEGKLKNYANATG
jgi:Icc-related predicted phosphoesterase